MNNNLDLCLVVGDSMIAHDLLHTRPQGAGNVGVAYDPEDKLRVYFQSGGAIHLNRILNELEGANTPTSASHGLASASDSLPESPRRVLSRYPRKVSEYAHAHTLWAPCEMGGGVKDIVWRVANYLGTVDGITVGEDEIGSNAGSSVDTRPQSNLGCAVNTLADITAHVAGKKLVVVLDENLGFVPRRTASETEAQGIRGEQTNQTKFEFAESKDHLPWLVLKISHASSAEDLLTRINRVLASIFQPQHIGWGRLVLLIPASLLRQFRGRVGANQSWATTMNECKAAINDLFDKCAPAFVVVNFAPDSVAVFQSDNRETRLDERWDCWRSIPPKGVAGGSLVFSNGTIEGDFKRVFPGKVVGHGTCVVAAVVWQLYQYLSLCPQESEVGTLSCRPLTVNSLLCVDKLKGGIAAAIERGIALGLVASRRLHQYGYCLESNTNIGKPESFETNERRLGPPFRSIEDFSVGNADKHNPTTSNIVSVIRAAESSFNGCTGKTHLEVDSVFTESGFGNGNTECTMFLDYSLYPICKIGLPRTSNDSRGLAKEIVGRGFEGRQDTPSLTYARFERIREFDPDQTDMLAGLRALLKQHIENPSRALKPLSIAVFGPPGAGKSFTVRELARAVGFSKESMLTFNLSQFEDPAYLMGALHQVAAASIQSCPLVFFDEFDTPLQGRPLGWLRYFLAPMQDGEFTEGTATFHIGAPVFVFAGGTAARFVHFGAHQGVESELRALKLPDFVSRLRGTLDIPGVDPDTNDVSGVHHLRRANILRGAIENLWPHVVVDGTVNVEASVLKAFLDVSHYKHGARSLEAIVSMSNLRGSLQYTASLLPPPHLLALHVDAMEFMQIIRR